MPTPKRTLRLKLRLRAKIEEAIRMRECPGIHFADEAAGRVAKVTGTGLGVWELIGMHRGAGGSTQKLRARHPHLSEAQITAALTYYEQHPEEIDEIVAENETLHGAGKARQDSTARRR
ncbi:MAG: DUF433 domain-containing protein [Candidatus Rokubacteria bacterium]|nr:DUF433 domain-containing protein [Candidatus Rokubacteria bacterium]